jgi:hypothetical protein
LEDTHGTLIEKHLSTANFEQFMIYRLGVGNTSVFASKTIAQYSNRKKTLFFESVTKILTG